MLFVTKSESSKPNASSDFDGQFTDEQLARITKKAEAYSLKQEDRRRAAEAVALVLTIPELALLLWGLGNLVMAKFLYSSLGVSAIAGVFMVFLLAKPAFAVAYHLSYWLAIAPHYLLSKEGRFLRTLKRKLPKIYDDVDYRYSEIFFEREARRNDEFNARNLAKEKRREQRELHRETRRAKRADKKREIKESDRNLLLGD